MVDVNRGRRGSAGCTSRRDAEFGPATARGAGPDAARSALRKLVRALPQTFRADAEAAASATMIDPARWGERDRDRPALVDVLQSAVVRRRKVCLTYAGRTRERTERLVDPWGLVDKDDIWYLVGGTERRQRTFRVDRIVAAEPTGSWRPSSRHSVRTTSLSWRASVPS